MLTFPEINPVALELGPVRVHWYGVMYLLGFGLAWWLGRRRASAGGWAPGDVDDIIFYGAMGVIVGGRLGYIAFYDLPQFLSSPLSLFAVWRGGMSFHGGLLGVLIAMWLLARSRGRGFFEVTDFLAPLVPLGLGFGRLGNFINGNLWGKESALPWAMVFPDPRAAGVPRHPSQLYEAALEGLALFVLLWIYSARPRPTMAVSGLFLLAYGVFRFAIEFVRIPDAHLGYLAFGWVTMGHLLTLPMVAGGAILLNLARNRPVTQARAETVAPVPAPAPPTGTDAARRKSRGRARGRRR